MTAVDGQAYTWDANGLLLHDGQRTYDQGGRLRTVVGPGLSAGYAYNGLGERLRVVQDGQPLTLTLDLGGELSQVLAAGEQRYLYGLERLAQLEADTPTYHLADRLGSLRLLVDASGAVQRRVQAVLDGDHEIHWYRFAINQRRR